MALHFLVDDDLTAVRVGDDVTLTGAEARHASVVRRVRAGESVTVGDGRGVWLSGAVSHAEPARVVVHVDAREELPAPERRLVLVQALAKGDRDELAVQAAIELGADEIVPWQAARSVSRWEGPKVAKGVGRWGSIVREAAKQAHRAWVPMVTEPVTTAQLATRPNARLLVLEPSASAPLSALALDDGDDDRDLVLIVGPEGGIAPEELSALAVAGAEVVRLGDAVLRTSTAGPAGLAVLSVRLGRW